MPNIKLVSTPFPNVEVTDPEQIYKLPVYGVEVPGTRPADGSETGIYRSAVRPTELVKDFPTIKTCHDAFENGLKISPNGNCLGHRPSVRDPVTGELKSGDYVWQSYKQVAERRINFGCGLMKVYNDVVKETEPKWKLGIYAVNRPEWIIADLASQSFSLCTVALYDTLGPEASEFILNHSEIPIVVTSVDKVANLIKLSPNTPKVKVVICMDVIPNIPGSPYAILKQWAAEKGLVLMNFKEVEELGVKNRVALPLPTPDDLACISYTSGTTGNPKGAMLTHANLIATFRSHVDGGASGQPTDIHISYLPLAHIYERAVVVDMLAAGAQIGFFRGDVALLLDDIAVLRPTIFISVPRLLNRIYERIWTTATTSGSAVKTALFKRAVESKLANMKATGSLTHPLWDALVFRKVKAALGGRVRFICSGSAPISMEVLNFLRVAFGCQVLEGYGSTESASGLTVNWQNDFNSHTVGAPCTCNEVKLVSVPEMNYNATDKPFPRGEIWVRGSNVFAGYYKDEEKTRDALTEDGWLKMGDIGYVDEKGRVVIIDRKKNIFKLAQGEYVAPEKVENTYIASPLIAQIFVHGDSLQSELVAVVTLDAEHAIPLAKRHRLIPDSVPNPGPTMPGQPMNPALIGLAQSAKFKELLMKDMHTYAVKDKLRGFEHVKNVCIATEFFTGDNNLMTPTFKLKRNEAAIRFRPEIDAMYKEILAKKSPASKL
ncbi:hypothetical protein HDV05_002174 [Chytridiales sp. JEL 0842]|nr:hypothetical protein HDV05_002174 [Chytridiales sp. JEL 0842]